MALEDWESKGFAIQTNLNGIEELANYHPQNNQAYNVETVVVADFITMIPSGNWDPDAKLIIESLRLREVIPNDGKPAFLVDDQVNHRLPVGWTIIKWEIKRIELTNDEIVPIEVMLDTLHWVKDGDDPAVPENIKTTSWVWPEVDRIVVPNNP